MAASLEESEHRFWQLFAKAPAGIALIDPKGKIQECNVALGRLIGREPQALRQVSLFDLVAGSDVAPLEAALAPHGDTTEAGKPKGATAPAPEVHLASDEGPVCTHFVTRPEGSDGPLAGFVLPLLDSIRHKNP